jgi:3-methyladenine DNA glycosylase AlkD
MNYREIFASFEAHVDPARAEQMSAYMRHQFPFLGIPTPERKALSRDFYRAALTTGIVDWDFVERCWKKRPREYQYLAVGYLAMLKDRLGPEDVPRLKNLVTAKSWWDTVDGLDRIVGRIALSFPAVNRMLLEWSRADNIWLRRVAIDHQLDRKGQTNTALLEEIILNNLGQEEFFINKAIGWSLREYSKTNPGWVKAFLDRHRSRLSSLSIREGGKYV